MFIMIAVTDRLKCPPPLKDYLKRPFSVLTSKIDDIIVISRQKLKAIVKADEEKAARQTQKEMQQFVQTRQTFLQSIYIGHSKCFNRRRTYFF